MSGIAVVDKKDPKFASAVKMLEEVMCLCHTALSAEAMALGAKRGLDLDILYSAICGAIGSCWSFIHRVPGMFKGTFEPSSTDSIDQAIQTLSAFSAQAKSHKLSHPLISLVLQQYIAASSLGHGGDSTSSIISTYHLGDQYVMKGEQVGGKWEAAEFAGKVGFVGLGSMGFGMASILVKAGIKTTGFDAWAPSMERFSALEGADTAKTAKEACEGAAVVILMVVSAQQVEEVLFAGGVADGESRNRAMVIDSVVGELMGEGGSAVMAQGGVVCLMATVAPTAALALQTKLHSLRPDLQLLDCPVSGGVGRAALGDLTILCSGEDVGIQAALPVLKAMSGALGNEGNLCILPGGVGAGSSVKLAHQCLAGTQIHLVAEIMAFAARLGLPRRLTHEILLKSTATGGILAARGKNMLDGQLKANSTVDIWLKDLGIVIDEARAVKVPVYFAAFVLQSDVMASANGWGLDDDSSVTRLWGQTGIVVAESE